jgi:hypothetical protein
MMLLIKPPDMSRRGAMTKSNGQQAPIPMWDSTDHGDNRSSESLRVLKCGDMTAIALPAVARTDDRRDGAIAVKGPSVIEERKNASEPSLPLYRRTESLKAPSQLSEEAVAQGLPMTAVIVNPTIQHPRQRRQAPLVTAANPGLLHLRRTDVLLGRGPQCYDHVGNVAWRAWLPQWLPAYRAAAQKQPLLQQLVRTWQTEQHGRFLATSNSSSRQQRKRHHDATNIHQWNVLTVGSILVDWHEADDARAWDKVGQTLRALVRASKTVDVNSADAPMNRDRSGSTDVTASVANGPESENNSREEATCGENDETISGTSSSLGGLSNEPSPLLPLSGNATCHSISVSTTIPGGRDVLIGRGPRVYNHAGNREFRQLVARYRNDYAQARLVERSNITKQLVHTWNHEYQGRFLEPAHGGWIEAGHRKACAKASQSLRGRPASDKGVVPKPSLSENAVEQGPARPVPVTNQGSRTDVECSGTTSLPLVSNLGWDPPFNEPAAIAGSAMDHDGALGNRSSIVAMDMLAFSYFAMEPVGGEQSSGTLLPDEDPMSAAFSITSEESLFGVGASAECMDHNYGSCLPCCVATGEGGDCSMLLPGATNSEGTADSTENSQAAGCICSDEAFDLGDLGFDGDSLAGCCLGDFDAECTDCTCGMPTQQTMCQARQDSPSPLLPLDALSESDEGDDSVTRPIHSASA